MEAFSVTGAGPLLLQGYQSEVSECSDSLSFQLQVHKRCCFWNPIAIVLQRITQSKYETRSTTTQMQHPPSFFILKTSQDFYSYLGWWYCAVREGIWNTAQWFHGQHTWIHLVNWRLNPTLQRAKMWHKASQLPQMVPNSLFSKRFQMVCLFWISQTLMGDIILE